MPATPFTIKIQRIQRSSRPPSKAAAASEDRARQKHANQTYSDLWQTSRPERMARDQL